MESSGREVMEVMRKRGEGRGGEGMGGEGRVWIMRCDTERLDGGAGRWVCLGGGGGWGGFAENCDGERLDGS